MRRAGPGKVEMYICLHNAESRGNSETQDRRPSAFMQKASAPLELTAIDCKKPCWKYWCFYCTSYYDKFHFPFSFPSLFLASPHLASSFYSQLHRFMIALIATLAVASRIISIPINISFGQDSVFPFFLAFTALRFFLIPSGLFLAFFTWWTLLSSKWLTAFPLQHHWQPLK